MVSTIFFDGFGPHGGEHIGQIDPVYWNYNSGASLSGYRNDRAQSTINGTSNGLDFMGHTFGSVVRLDNHVATSNRSYLKASNFPAVFSAQDTAFGMGFFINKIATDSVARPDSTSGTNYASALLNLINRDNSVDNNILKLEAVHLGSLGYPNNNPKMGLKVYQTVDGLDEAMGTFTFDVWGAPWYTEQNPNNVSTNYQRTIGAYNYKYGGLYTEICVMKDASTVADVTATVSGSVSSGSTVVVLNSVTGLSVGMAVVSGTSGIPNNTSIQSIDTNNVSITLSSATTSTLADASSLGFTKKTYSLQIKVNGMNLLVDGTTNDKKIYLKNNWSTFSNKYFNSCVFYGARVPTDPNGGTPNPLAYSYIHNGQVINQGYMYETYIDNIYIVGGLNDQDCFLGPTTKVFNIAPVAGSTVNTNNEWQAFNLQWDTNTSIEENLKDSNGDRSYVYTEINGAVLAMDMANIPDNPNYAVGGIKITNSVRKSNKDTSFTNVWGSGNTLADITPIGTNFAVNNNHYEYKNQYFLNNPVTNQPWTFTDINGGKFGIKKTQ
jgi:hypothetical protein